MLPEGAQLQGVAHALRLPNEQRIQAPDRGGSRESKRSLLSPVTQLTSRFYCIKLKVLV